MRVPPRSHVARRAAACTALLPAMLALVVVSGGTLAAAQAPAAAAPDAASPAKAAAPEPAAPEPAAAVPKPSAAEEKPADDAAAKPPLPDKPRILPPFRQLPVVTEEQEKAFRAQLEHPESLRNGTIPPDQEQASANTTMLRRAVTYTTASTGGGLPRDCGTN